LTDGPGERKVGSKALQLERKGPFLSSSLLIVIDSYRSNFSEKGEEI
jgi:hypothetical protein